MPEYPDIPVPFRFNAFKHHRNYALEFIKQVSFETLMKELDPICNNYVDVYTGNLSPVSICGEVAEQLLHRKTFGEEGYKNWLRKEGAYHTLRISDSSRWIVRQGNEDERYIHIHPARTGVHVIRLKGSTLKTAYILKQNLANARMPDLNEVNRVRKQIGLSPVRRLEAGKGILKCFGNFFAKNKSFI